MARSDLPRRWVAYAALPLGSLGIVYDVLNDGAEFNGPRTLKEKVGYYGLAIAGVVAFEATKLGTYSALGYGFYKAFLE